MISEIKLEKAISGLVRATAVVSGPGAHTELGCSFLGEGYSLFNSIRNYLTDIRERQDCTRLIVTVGNRKHTISEAIRLAEKAKNAHSLIREGWDSWNMEKQLDNDLKDRMAQAQTLRQTTQEAGFCGGCGSGSVHWDGACLVTRVPATLSIFRIALNKAYDEGLAKGREEVAKAVAVVQEKSDLDARRRANSDRELVDRLDKSIRYLTTIRDAKKGTLS